MSGPHVLVVRPDNAGDVLLAGPAVRAVAGGAGHVTLLAGPAGAAAAALLPGVDDVMVESLPWIDPDPAPVAAGAVGALVARLAALSLDEAVVLTSFHQSALPTALVLRMAAVAKITAVSEDYPGSLLDVRHLPDEHLHEVERGLSVAAAAGYALDADDDGALAVRLAEGPGAPAPLGPERYVVLHPGASVPARAWEPERYRQLATLLADAGWTVAVTGASAERALTAHVAAAPGAGVVDLGGTTSLAELAGVLAGADVVVTGNTGPAHLAAAVGTPVVSLYAPTVPAERWRPWMVPHVLLGDQGIGCAGCRARRCPVAGHPCIAGVDAAQAVAAVARLAPAGPLDAAGRGTRRAVA